MDDKHGVEGPQVREASRDHFAFFTVHPAILTLLGTESTAQAEAPKAVA